MDVELQQLHYDRLDTRYERHYGDVCSLDYREKYINERMFAGLELDGKHVLEAMCGSGQTTGHLLSRGARVTGLDVSPQQVNSFNRRWPGVEARCASIFDSKIAAGSFDLVAIVGGLHHLHPKCALGISEIYRLLRPGGWFCFAEPHKGSLPDAMRKLWYRYDKLFAPNEASIDLDQLKSNFAGKFEFLSEHYGGNLAYLFVLNSMIFRIPLRLKPFYTPPAMACESFVNKLQAKWSSCFVVCQWQKL
jgi:SAM-dependent methyltransferase